jgi:hypothetical protein
MHFKESTPHSTQYHHVPVYLPKVYSMNKFGLTLAMATAIALLPSIAKADGFNFTITGNGVTASGVITVATTGTPGVDEITGIYGTYSDSGISNAQITGMYPDPTFSPIEDSHSLFIFDNLFYESGNSGLALDYYGMVFTLDNGGYVGVCGTSCTTGGLPYNLNVVDATGNYTHNNEGIGVTFSPAATPEPSSLMLFGTGVLGLAGAARRKLFS